MFATAAEDIIIQRNCGKLVTILGNEKMNCILHFVVCKITCAFHIKVLFVFALCNDVFVVLPFKHVG